MVDYITTNDFERFRREIPSDVLQRRVREARQRSPEGTTFLSHSSKDDHLMPMVVHILENHGATVYLDDRDPALSAKPGREVAKLLRSRIRVCRKFILFASKHVRDSKWVPWELGLSDGFKNPGNTAIFPAVDSASETTWTKQEYLGAYDRVVWGTLQGHEKPLWMVWNQDENSAVTLAQWLSR